MIGKQSIDYIEIFRLNNFPEIVNIFFRKVFLFTKIKNSNQSTNFTIILGPSRILEGSSCFMCLLDNQFLCIYKTFPRVRFILELNQQPLIVFTFLHSPSPFWSFLYSH